MRAFFLRAGWVLAAVVAAAVFLPWVKLQIAPFNRAVERVKVVGALALEGDGPWYVRYFELDAYDRKAAFDEPLRGESALEFVQLSRSPALPKQQRARQIAAAFGLKSAALGAVVVVAAPALALLGMAFFSLGLRALVGVTGLLAGAYYGVARYGLDATFTERTINGVDAGLGLWLALYALLGIAVLLLLSLIVPAGNK